MFSDRTAPLPSIVPQQQNGTTTLRIPEQRGKRIERIEGHFEEKNSPRTECTSESRHAMQIQHAQVPRRTTQNIVGIANTRAAHPNRINDAAFSAFGLFRSMPSRRHSAGRSAVCSCDQVPALCQRLASSALLGATHLESAVF